MKKYVFISIVAGSSIVVGLISSLITYSIVQKKADAKKKELAEYAFQVHFNDKCETFRTENKYIKDVDISFIGDSLTEGFDVKKYFPEYNVVNRGISGDTTYGVEKRLDVSAYEVNPKVISLLIGANNFDTMLNNYSKILDGFKQNIPETKIVLCSLTSMTDEWARNNHKAIENNNSPKVNNKTL